MKQKSQVISLINVVNSLDIDDRPVGHELKCLQDLCKLLKGKVEILAGQRYMHALKISGKMLPYSAHSGVKEKRDLLILKNYIVSLIKAEGDILVYITVPEALLWWIALYRGKRKIVLLTYNDWSVYQQNILKHQKIRQWLINRGLRRSAGCIVTNKNYTPRMPYVRIPDYYINDDIEIYQRTEKKRGCICLGEMRYGKDIAGLARCLIGTDIPLKIVGVFSDKNMYDRTMQYSKDNVQVINKNLPYAEYLKELSLHQYFVLPYDLRTYTGKTSGVLQEGIFVGSIPIAPCSILRQNGIQGLGYHDMREIPSLIQKYEQGKIQVNNCLMEYQFINVQRKLNLFISKMLAGKEIEDGRKEKGSNCLYTILQRCKKIKL